MNAFAHFDRLQSARAPSFPCACSCHIQPWSIVPAESCAGACKEDDDTGNRSNRPVRGSRTGTTQNRHNQRNRMRHTE